mmetsp:Transcript_3133/g.11219  ORF Transcript_3133/g.11219 Transcript_3133/m.11219 type:complete len:250 (+) Transcript_3133:473-1222(+)
MCARTRRTTHRRPPTPAWPRTSSRTRRPPRRTAPGPARAAPAASAHRARSPESSTRRSMQHHPHTARPRPARRRRTRNRHRHVPRRRTPPAAARSGAGTARPGARRRPRSNPRDRVWQMLRRRRRRLHRRPPRRTRRRPPLRTRRAGKRCPSTPYARRRRPARPGSPAGLRRSTPAWLPRSWLLQRWRRRLRSRTPPRPRRGRPCRYHCLYRRRGGRRARSGARAAWAAWSPPRTKEHSAQTTTPADLR